MKKLGVLLVCMLALGMVFGSVPVMAASENLFPENLFSSADVCGEYFHNADEAGTIYEEENGEYIMTMPIHTAFNYLYTKEAIPYESFTVSFDFYLIISPDSHFHEMDLLVGMSGEAKPFHQASVVAQNESLFMKHYTLDEEWSEYKEDEYFYGLYDEECWQTFKAAITPAGVEVYINDEFVGFLTDTEDCIGDRGYIGLRAGSSGGWKIKNLSVVSNMLEETEQPAEEVTDVPSGDVTETSSPAPTQDVLSGADGSGFPVWIAIVIGAVVIVAGVATWLVLKKKK